MQLSFDSAMLKRLIRGVLTRWGYAIFRTRGRYHQDGLYSVHNQSFRRTQPFREAYRRGVDAAGGADPELEWRVHIALWAAATALDVRGDFVECGVNAGFISSAILRGLDWNSVGRRFYLVDTFSGPVIEQLSPEEVAHGRLQVTRDALAAGMYVTDMERVRRNYEEWPNAVVVQGVVPEVLTSLPDGRIAFLHIDLNCALPECAALRFFWDRLSDRAIVLLDDYGYYGHESQGRAMDELAAELGARILCLPTGQGLIVRL